MYRFKGTLDSALGSLTFTFKIFQQVHTKFKSDMILLAMQNSKVIFKDSMYNYLI